MTATVAMPTPMPYQFQSAGVASAPDMEVPFDAPRNFGTWLAMMIKPTPVK